VRKSTYHIRERPRWESPQASINQAAGLSQAVSKISTVEGGLKECHARGPFVVFALTPPPPLSAIVEWELAMRLYAIKGEEIRPETHMKRKAARYDCLSSLLRDGDK
jgi:hypothetical protein